MTPPTTADPGKEGYTERVVLLGDPQLHNSLGGSLKKMTRFADVINVAIRPPTLDLLSPLVLRHLVDEARKRHGQPDLVVALGDVGNIACLSELNAFSRVMTSAGGEDGMTWLAAHGNHDSFLMGINQKWGRPTSRPFSPEAMACAALPPCLDGGEASGVCCPARGYSAWTAAESRDFATHEKGNSWPQACGGREGEADAVPADKLVWLAWYLAHLSREGVPLDLTPEAPAGGDDARVWRVQSRPAATGTLAARRFEVSGRWVSPADMRDLERWLSYVVQSFDVAPGRRMILVDTSVGATFDERFEFRGATGVAALGEAQVKDIEDHIGRARKRGQVVILAGHMPLKDFSDTGRASIDAWGVAEYVSAHTHKPTMTRCRGEVGARELNIGSTTDWPMELVVRDFARPLTEDAAALEVIALGDRKGLGDWGGGRLTRFETLAGRCTEPFHGREWSWEGALRRQQVCSHQRAARAITDAIERGAAIGPDEIDAVCLGSLADAEGDVAGAQQRIAGLKLDSPAAVRLLCAARAASRSEGVQ